MAINYSNALIGSSGSGGYKIQRSLRFRSSASAYLSRTPASAGSQTTWTWSGWVKRGTLALGRVFSSGTLANIYGTPVCFSNDSIDFLEYNSGIIGRLTTTQVFRDPSAWYHIIVVWDSGNATSGDRMRMYANGLRVTAFSTATYPTLNQPSTTNNGTNLYLGAINAGGLSQYFDGYLAEVNFIDGQALTPSSFGQTDAVTGVWTPKKYTGTYGTNGFYLPFSDNTSATTLAYDKSGNGNNWTPNNISTTAGATYDSMTDVPTLTSATSANYCTLNPLDKNSSMTASDGNLTLALPSSTATIRSTVGVSSGKWYWEVTSSAGNADSIGVANASAGLANYVGGDANGWCYYQSNGKTINNAVQTTYGTNYGASVVVGVALDMDNGKIWFSNAGTWQASGNPATGANPAFTGLTGTLFPATGTAGTAGTQYANFGQRPFSYTPPTGFKALNTFNLPDPTIKKPNQYMDATTYTGTGSALSVTNAAGFQPDFVWVKGRSGATDHALYDAVRGVQKQLESNTTTAETTETTGLTAFNSNGFSVGALAQMNTNAATYVGWQWQAGKGTTSSNTSGSRTSTVSVNATAGFSIVSYTGQTNTPATIGHGLGVAPKFIITKNRTTGTYDGDVWHTALAGTQYLVLNSTAAVATNANAWNSTTPTSTVFSVGQFGGTCGLTGDNMIAYCWAEIAGFSAFGSYTGNGSADGPFVYCGFRPRYFLIKNTSTTTNWIIYDNARQPYNTTNPGPIYANLSSAEESNVTLTAFDVLSNGFKPRNTSSWAESNASGNTYIYAAFAESPFKYSLAR